MVIGNKYFGDPACGLRKELKIIYDNGNIKIFHEYSTLQLHDIIFNTQIIKASNIKQVSYGKDSQLIDVTTIVKDLYSKGVSQIPISNRLFTDPYPGMIKELRLKLTNDSVKIYKEGTIMNIDDIKI